MVVSTVRAYAVRVTGRQKTVTVIHFPVQWLLNMQRKHKRHSPELVFGSSVLGYLRNMAVNMAISVPNDILPLAHTHTTQCFLCSWTHGYGYYIQYLLINPTKRTLAQPYECCVYSLKFQNDVAPTHIGGLTGLTASLTRDLSCANIFFNPYHGISVAES